MRFCFTFILLLTLNALFGQQFNAEVVSERLQRQLLDQDGYHDIYIMLNDRVDVASLNEAFNHRGASLEERSAELITKLQAKANSTQSALLTMLNDKNGVDNSSIHPYWITNMIFCSAKREIIAELSFHDDIAWIDLNAALEITDYKNSSPEEATFVEPNGTEPGLWAINAPAMWALGYTGYGKVAMINDTGVDPNHPAYKLKYRGMYVPEDQAWFQYNSTNTTPFDCSGHGSHVLGTVLGLDRNEADTIGVAFNSLWVGSPGIVCAFRGTESTVGAFQWALDPDGDPGTITDMPDVINNSWYDPGDENECEGPYIDVLTALEAAGVAVVFSAGNAGPDSASITPPHNINIDLVNVFCVGALNANNPLLNIASFSSIGPSDCGGVGSLLIKPEVSAPGVNVRSVEYTGGYSLKSGTSMAAPHVSGAILLLKEAFPYLTGTELKLALYHSCTDLGDPGEDNTYGMGIIDVFAAYNYLIDLGNTPADPHVERDLILMDADIEEYFCKGEAYASVKVENAGTSEINSFNIYYEVSGLSNASGVFNWTGSLPVGEKAFVELPALPFEAGIHDYHITIAEPNGLADQRPLNNAYYQKIIGIEDFDFEVYVDQLNGNSACKGARALLRAEHHEEATIHWFSQAEGGDPITSGDDFLVADLDSTITYFADMTLHVSTALEEPDNIQAFTETEGGIVFDCYAPFTLESVTIYPQTTGVCIISLRTSDDMGLGSKTLLLTNTGKQEVTLGMKVPKGIDLVLKIQEGIPLSHTDGDIPYPFEVPSVLNIKSSNDSLDAEQRYYYFYDWKIDYDKFCDRLPIPVEVQESDNPPSAAFIPSTKYLDLDISGEVGFTDLSAGGNLWHWNFGDETSSTLSGPSHIYTDTGTFIVSQTIVNTEGCTDTAIDTVRVTGSLVNIEDPGISEDLVSIFPVPAQNLLNIRFGFHKSHDIQIRIFDVVGREVIAFVEKAYYKETKKIDLSQLKQGIYFVAFQVEGHSFVKKIIVQR